MSTVTWSFFQAHGIGSNHNRFRQMSAKGSLWVTRCTSRTFVEGRIAGEIWNSNESRFHGCRSSFICRVIQGYIDPRSVHRNWLGNCGISLVVLLFFVVQFPLLQCPWCGRCFGQYVQFFRYIEI